jgi:inosine-uridine nucleoside N-ribohydrolase
VGLGVGNRTLVKPDLIAQLAQTPGPEDDFVVGVLKFLEGLSERFGDKGVAMYDPLAVGAAIDPSLITTKAMRVDIELRGQFTRGETVANRRNAIEQNVPHGDHLWIAGLQFVHPNVNVAVDVNAQGFLNLFQERIANK